MNVSEGARRMKHAGKWLIFAPLTAALVLLGIGLAGLALHQRFAAAGAGGVISLGLFANLVIFGVVLWIAGWIVEGFAGN